MKSGVDGFETRPYQVINCTNFKFWPPYLQEKAATNIFFFNLPMATLHFKFWAKSSVPQTPSPAGNSPGVLAATHSVSSPPSSSNFLACLAAEI